MRSSDLHSIAAMCHDVLSEQPINSIYRSTSRGVVDVSPEAGAGTYPRLRRLGPRPDGGGRPLAAADDVPSPDASSGDTCECQAQGPRACRDAQAEATRH